MIKAKNLNGVEADRKKGLTFIHSVKKQPIIKSDGETDIFLFTISLLYAVL